MKNVCTQKCKIQPTFINLHPNEYTREFYYYFYYCSSTNFTTNFTTICS